MVAVWCRGNGLLVASWAGGGLLVAGDGAGVGGSSKQ